MGDGDSEREEINGETHELEDFEQENMNKTKWIFIEFYKTAKIISSSSFMP